MERSATPRADVLLVTVTDAETDALRAVFAERHGRDFTISFVGDKSYYSLGTIGGARTFLVRSEMGAGGVGGATLTAAAAINDLRPPAIIMLGIAFGLRPQSQQIGDILVSRQIMLYDLQRVGSDGQGEILTRTRGERAAASHWLLDRFRTGRDSWHGADIDFGLVLSGDKLVDNPHFRDQLLRLEPEAIGGEMEGAGLYAAAQRNRVDWILVKAIADWADGNKGENKKANQALAARNAALFTMHVIEQGGLLRQPAEPAPAPPVAAPHAPIAPPAITPQRLRQILVDRLDAQELRTICFDLGVDYEDLSGETRSGKALALITYLTRRQALAQLLDWLRDNRPDIALS